jgi:hypothetical protein
VKTWVRVLLLLTLLAVLAFLKIFEYSLAGFHMEPTIMGRAIYWSLAFMIDLIVGYLYLVTTRDLDNNRMINIFLLATGLAIVVIIFFLGLPLVIWSQPTIPGPI